MRRVQAGTGLGILADLRRAAMMDLRKLCRREFLGSASCAAISLFALPANVALAIDHSGSRPVVKNRAPLAVSRFQLFPAGSINPEGWLKSQLQIQAAGLGGKLDEVWPDVGPNSGWLGGTGESWSAVLILSMGSYRWHGS